ncbi:MAG: hypothetical protein ACLUR5_03635 [Eubacterium ventriosum]
MKDTGKLPENIPDVKRVINNAKVSDHHALLPTMNVTETTFENGLNEMESEHSPSHMFKAPWLPLPV